MTTHTVIGVDPGMTTGIAALTYAVTWTPSTFPDKPPRSKVVRVDFAQITPDLVVPLVEHLIGARTGAVRLAIEAFVVGRGSMRSGAAGAMTRKLIGDVANLRDPQHVAVRAAALVKPWATDIRLAHAGLLVPTKGMPHARDAARHALYDACLTVAPDPLSRKARA